MDLQSFMRQQADQEASLLADLNQSLWNYAEFGYQEFQSSQKIKEVLEQEGFEVELGVGGLPTAIKASFGKSGPVIGILGEYDALPNLSQEAGATEQRPIPGAQNGHGCGHSALGAGAVGAAILAKRYLQETQKEGTIQFWGCPAEETGFGKTFMAREGCFSNLDAALTWHPSHANKAGAARTVAYYKVRFDFHGRTAHAGTCPELGRSALDACELMNVGVNYLREHIMSQVRVHYAYLDCGGSSPNVVQETSSLLYFVRAPKLKQCTEVLERIQKIAEGAALMTETKVKISVLGGVSDIIPNRTLAEVLSESFVEQGGPDFTEEDYALARNFIPTLPQQQCMEWMQKAALLNHMTLEEFKHRPLDTAINPFNPESMKVVVTGSSDVGDVSYLVPTAQIMVAASIPGTSPHTWQFTSQMGTSFSNKACVAAARALGTACAKLYDRPEILKQAKEELLKETHGEYQCPIPKEIDYTQVNP